MSILMTELKETQMWAIYQMGTGDKMPVSVTKNDLTCIIAFLLKKLDWVDNGELGWPNMPQSQKTFRATSSSRVFCQKGEENALKCPKS